MKLIKKETTHPRRRASSRRKVGTGGWNQPENLHPGASCTKLTGKDADGGTAVPRSTSATCGKAHTCYGREPRLPICFQAPILLKDYKLSKVVSGLSPCSRLVFNIWAQRRRIGAPLALILENNAVLLPASPPRPCYRPAAPAASLL